VEYFFKAPSDLGDRLVIVVDPMLATANSAIAAVDKLKSRGATNIRFVCLLAAPEGIERFTNAHPDVPVFTASIDSHLNDHGYIVPGLGDAGDRMYGTRGGRRIGVSGGGSSFRAIDPFRAGSRGL
jgi:uracil phosphoribosyltransferase